MLDVRAAAEFFAPGGFEGITDEVDATDISVFFIESVEGTDF